MVIKIFQANLNLLWNMRLAKSIFFFPKQTGIGLENCTQFLGVTFPNKPGFGLEQKGSMNNFVCHICVLSHFLLLKLCALLESKSFIDIFSH